MRFRYDSFIHGVLALTVAALASGPGPQSLPTSVDNFYLRGTQPGQLEPMNEIIPAAYECSECHHDPVEAPIFKEWNGSLMGQAARDPLMRACLDIAEADAPGSGDTCIRCHAPKGWLEGRSTPTNGSALTAEDRDSITCNFCHRLVDPFARQRPYDKIDPNTLRPAPDLGILANLGIDQPIQSVMRGVPGGPGDGGNGSYVVDPFDRRRGPFPIQTGPTPGPGEVNCDGFHFGFTYGKCVDEFNNPTGCDTYESMFHRRSELCATCHDVSVPHFSYNKRGTALVFNGAGNNHPDGNKYNMVPEQRTYSEWLQSDFNTAAGVNMGDRYGCGNETIRECQSCHQRPQNVKGCAFVSQPRPDIPNHRFLGASTWVLNAIGLHWGPDGPLPGHPPPSPESPELTMDTAFSLAETAQENVRKIMTCAATLQVSLDDTLSPGTDQLKVRVINETGHKLPTGYPEGRRMWLTVEFFDCTNYSTPAVIKGWYNPATAELDSATTKVYRASFGLDAELAALLKRPAGPSDHLLFANKVYLDNRIPPRGFTNLKFAAIQAEPVGCAYADGQYWDDTLFEIPSYAVAARVSLYYQSATKEYVEFLRDNNPQFGQNTTHAGQLLYDLWVDQGKSMPVRMAVYPPPTIPDCNIDPDPAYPCGNPEAAIGLMSIELKGDCDGNRAVSFADIPTFVDALTGVNTDVRVRCAADMNSAGGPNGLDIQPFVEELLTP